MPETLNELFSESIGHRMAAEIYRARQNREWISWRGAEVKEKVEAISLGLHALGIRPGDRVALLSESRPEWSMVDFGILGSGAVNVPIYPTQAVEQVAYILRDSGAKILFLSTARQYQRVQSAISSLEEGERPALIFFEAEAVKGVAGAQTLDGLFALGEESRSRQPALVEELRGHVTPDDLATIIYTSGTTGVPKGVMLTHRNIVSNVLASGEVFQLEPSDLALSFLPLSHVFERTVLYIYLWRGVAICFARGVETVAEDIRDVRPTIMTAVPRLFERIYGTINKRVSEAKPLQQRIFHRAIRVGREVAQRMDQGKRIPLSLALQHRLLDRLVFTKWRQAVGGRIRFFVSGGAALPSELAYIFLGAGIPILQGYGLTETSPVVSFNRPGENRIGSIGRPIPGVEVRVAPDGELLVQGENVMQGYYGMPEESAEVLRTEPDGLWFHTGDIGTIDEDGYIRITDRKKDLLKTSLGKYIAPQPIENLIRGIPMVEQVIVIGNARKYPVALIVPAFDALIPYARSLQIETQDRTALVRHPRIVEYFKKKIDSVTKGLAPHEKIKKIALLESDFSIDGGELTPTLKVRRKFVEEKHQAVIETLYPRFETD
jgi:long-chain acyl-CoA synthetase